MNRQSAAIQVDGARLDGDLAIPSNATGVVLFAHGSGSSRHSPRNRQVAQVLQDSGLATLLIDLLTREEEKADRATGELRFDIAFLAERLEFATGWLRDHEATSGLPIGYFGASTGAAAALMAAARTPAADAVVSRGGRPDLAEHALGHVKAPTLLIVGGRDHQVIEMNESALARLNCEKHMEIVEGATHLFEEPGALDDVASLARDWFLRYLAGEAVHHQL